MSKKWEAVQSGTAFFAQRVGWEAGEASLLFGFFSNGATCFKTEDGKRERQR